MDAKTLGARIEQRALLRDEPAPVEATVAPSGCTERPMTRWIVCSPPSVTSSPIPSTL
jgi:hypothetical protein